MNRTALSRLALEFVVLLGVCVAACTPTGPAPTSSERAGRGSPTASSSVRTGINASPEILAPTQSPSAMGAAPKDCPGPEPKAQTAADFIGPVVLGPPLWAGVYGTYDAATNSYSAPDAPLTEHGWRIKILFLLEPAQDSAVDLVGQGVHGTEGAVLFAIGGAKPSAMATFDPENPGIPIQNDGWREYPTYAYFPSPGCFQLRATWPGGGAELGFGIGG